MSEERDPADNQTAVVSENRVVVLPQIVPQAGKSYNWIDLNLREIPGGWTPAFGRDVIDGGWDDDEAVTVGSMALAWRANDEVLKAQAEEAQRLLDRLPHPAKPAIEADSLEAAMVILAERFKLVPFEGVPGTFDYEGVPAPSAIASDPEAIFLTKRRCVAEWLGRVLDFAEGKSTIYWRTEPEIEEINLSKHKGFVYTIGYRIYSRLSAA